jgi:hypothetical protein
MACGPSAGRADLVGLVRHVPPWALFAAPQTRASSRATATGRRPSLASISPRVLYSIEPVAQRRRGWVGSGLAGLGSVVAAVPGG